MSSPIRLTVNGTARDVRADADWRLLDVLRDELGLTGAKPGCGEGECGACTVLLDGEPTHSCRVTLGETAGRAVTTVEGLAAGGRLHPVQQAFAEAGAMQCGYCTPGMVLATAALLARQPRPDAAQVREALDGNLCRCCAYPRILRAVDRAAALLRCGEPGPAAPRADDAAGEPPVAPATAEPWDHLPPEARGYFDALGDGLVGVVKADPERHAGHHGGAWCHVGASGGVTAFTGKVDVGQETGTALTLLVAEELSLPVSAVRLIMGDTDVCPFDFGTFGSRSMPDAGPAMRRAAAAAREALLALAADRWALEPAALVAEDGRVRASDGREAAYGALVAGQRRIVLASPDRPLAPGTQWRTAGRRASSPGRLAAVAGTKRFPSDLSRPGMLHGRVLRAPALGAELVSLDLEAARALPGVTVVHEGDFVGVAAPSRAAAAAAIAAIEARWRIPPQPGERELAEHLRAHPVEVPSWQGTFHHEQGEVDRALAEAPLRLRATYTAAYIAHAPLETRAALAQWRDGRVTVWTGTQRPFGVRTELAQALGIPEARVRVIVPPTGSGFGGRHSGRAAVEAARLARAAGRPVRLTWTREEEFTCGYLRPAAIIDVEVGAASDGRMAAWTFTNLNSGAAGIHCPYDIPNQRLDHRPAASPLPQGSYRALAATANAFARESHLDELAHRVGADPLEFRLRHLRDDRLAAVLRAAAERAGWAARTRGVPGRGAGIAAGAEKGGRVATCAEVRVDADGRLEVLRLVTAFECGAIVHPEGLAQQVEGATVMGLGGALYEAIRFDGGRILNPSFRTYRVPRLRDVPPVEVILLDRPDQPPAGGGETPIIAVAPALASAIFAATGRRLRDLPLASDGVVR